MISPSFCVLVVLVLTPFIIVFFCSVSLIHRVLSLSSRHSCILAAADAVAADDDEGAAAVWRHLGSIRECGDVVTNQINPSHSAPAPPLITPAPPVPVQPAASRPHHTITHWSLRVSGVRVKFELLNIDGIHVGVSNANASASAPVSLCR